mmetsp:Transcript_94486/g.282084  ORF Transcript_94486/g.282084 Transcript_94486/m.282084 type:complete len:231 (-) Transcript_94486:17-709(-)
MVQWCDEAVFGDVRRLAPSHYAERFTTAYAPPRMPAGYFCTLAATTLRVLGAAPSEIGNILLDFLETKASARISKINYAKFTIKADVSGYTGACCAKVRIYQQEDGTCFVEFQRRSGDCICFSHLYQQAARYLQLRSLEVANAPRVERESASLLRGEGFKHHTAPLADLPGFPGWAAEGPDCGEAAAHAFGALAALKRCRSAAIASEGIMEQFDLLSVGCTWPSHLACDR